jgi:hypothetical protein
MVMTIDTREHTQHRPDHANSDLDIHKHLSGGDSEPAGYIVYLTEIELFATNIFQEGSANPQATSFISPRSSYSKRIHVRSARTLVLSCISTAMMTTCGLCRCTRARLPGMRF